MALRGGCLARYFKRKMKRADHEEYLIMDISVSNKTFGGTFDGLSKTLDKRPTDDAQRFIPLLDDAKDIAGAHSNRVPHDKDMFRSL